MTVATVAQLQTESAALAAVNSATYTPVVKMGFDTTSGFDLLQRVAKAFASSSLVPKQYQGNLPDCIIAVEMAARIGASPLMVAQNLYIVHGRPAWSSQFLIAAVNQCGRYSALQYEWSGTPGKDDWTCRAVATDRNTGARVQGAAVSIAMAKREGWYDKNGSKWQTMPELMLMYRAATFFARTNAPELTMGIASQEEVQDVYDGQPGAGPRRVGEAIDAQVLPASKLDQFVAAVTPPATAAEPEPLLSEPAKERIVALAAQGGISANLLDQALAEKYGCGLDKLPASMETDVLAWAQRKADAGKGKRS